MNTEIQPLQFDIVDGAIAQFTMPGETILDPFGGIGTVGYRAILKGRKAISIELNEMYWRDSVFYMQTAEQKISTPSLFDLVTEEESEEEITNAV